LGGELSLESTDHLPRYFLGDPKSGEKFHINIASGYDFDELWWSPPRKREPAWSAPGPTG
jgi:hypothetical protein